MTYTPDFQDLYQSILRCDAVYEPNADKAIRAFGALGSHVIDRISTEHNQAILHIAIGGYPTLTISGTRVSEGTLEDHIHDLMEDINCDPFDLGDGRLVAEEPFKQAAVIYDWVINKIGGDPINIEGHSLGGWKSTYASEYLNPNQIVSITAWESPKQGDINFWKSYTDRGLLGKLTQVFNGQDPWSLWPWIDHTLHHGPGQILWLKDGGWSWAIKDDLPDAMLLNGFELLNSNDHGPTSVVEAVKALAGRK